MSISYLRLTIALLISLAISCGRATPPSDPDSGAAAGSSPAADSSPAPDPMTVEGRVTMPGERGLPSDLVAYLFASDSPPPSLYGLARRADLREAMIENAAFRFEALDPGRYTVVVSDGRFPLSGALDFEVPIGDASPLSLPIATPCGFDVFVTGPDGKPVAGVAVSLLRTTGAIAVLGTTDDAGAFQFDEQPIGDYICNLKPPGAPLPIPKGMIGLREGPRDAAYYQLRADEIR